MHVCVSHVTATVMVMHVCCVTCHCDCDGDACVLCHLSLSPRCAVLWLHASFPSVIVATYAFVAVAFVALKKHRLQHLLKSDKLAVEEVRPPHFTVPLDVCSCSTVRVGC